MGVFLSRIGGRRCWSNNDLPHKIDRTSPPAAPRQSDAGTADQSRRGKSHGAERVSNTAERSTARAPGILARLVGGTSWAYLAAALCLWVFLRVAGDRSWFGTLALFGPRWLALTPLLILTPCALRLRRNALVALAGGAGIILFPVMGVCVPRTAGDSDIPGPTLRVMTCNVHRSALDVSAFARVVAEVRPDVIAVQEWTSAHGTAFLGEGQWFTQRDGELCLFSRFPIRKVENIATQAW